MTQCADPSAPSARILRQVSLRRRFGNAFHRAREGYGKLLLEWLKNRARAEGCAELHLDSGIQRKDAHRFYERNGVEASGHTFE